MAFTCFFSSTFDFNSFDEIFLLVYYYKNLNPFVLTNFLHFMKKSLEFDAFKFDRFSVNFVSGVLVSTILLDFEAFWKRILNWTKSRWSVTVFNVLKSSISVIFCQYFTQRFLAYLRNLSISTNWPVNSGTSRFMPWFFQEKPNSDAFWQHMLKHGTMYFKLYRLRVEKANS